LAKDSPQLAQLAGRLTAFEFAVCN